MTPPRRKSLGANLFASTGATAGRVVLGFAASVIVTRSLGAVGRGEFSFMLTLLGLLVMLGGAGSFAAVTTASARHGRTTEHLYPASAALAAGIGVILGVAFIVLYVPLRDSLFSGISATAIVAVAAGLVPTLVLNYWTAVTALDDRLVSFSLGTLAGAALYLGAVAVAAILGVLNTGTAFMLWLVGSLVPLATVVNRRRLRPTPGQCAAVAELFRHAARANFSDLTMLLVLRVDVLAVKGYRGFVEVGVYAVATGLAELVLLAGVALRVTFLRDQGRPTERDQLARLLCRSTRLLLAVGMAGVVVIALVAKPFITVVFGPMFAGAGLAAAILAPGVLAVALQGPLRDYLLVEGVTKVPTVTAIVTLVLNVALNVVLLQHHTYLVAAVTSTLAYVANFIACAWCFTRLTGIPARQLLVPERNDFTAIRTLIPRRG